MEKKNTQKVKQIQLLYRHLDTLKHKKLIETYICAEKIMLEEGEEKLERFKINKKFIQNASNVMERNLVYYFEYVLECKTKIPMKKMDVQFQTNQLIGFAAIKTAAKHLIIDWVQFPNVTDEKSR